MNIICQKVRARAAHPRRSGGRTFTHQTKGPNKGSIAAFLPAPACPVACHGHSPLALGVGAPSPEPTTALCAVRADVT